MGEKCISKLKSNRAAGIDRIEPGHLKFAHPAAAVHLKLNCVVTLCNMMLCNGKVSQLMGLVW